MILLVTLIVVALSYAGRLIQNSNLFLFFLILFLYGLTIITMSFMITPFFKKAESAGGLASFATMFFSLLYLLISLTRNSYSDVGPVSTIPVGAQWLLCLISPVALALAIDQVIFLAGFTSHISSCFQVLAIDQRSSSGVILVNIIIKVGKLKTETIIGRNAQIIPFKLLRKFPKFPGVEDT